LSDAAKLPEPGDLLGDFELLSTIGRGGFGAVYKAHQRRVDREAAVKVILPSVIEGDPQAHARFLREVDLVRRLEHPNIVRLYDFGSETSGLLWMATELVRGEVLSKVLKKDGPLTPERALKIAKQLASALVLAHEQGIVHRDLKPANIMLVDVGAEIDHVKVLDFGIGKALNTAETDLQLTKEGGSYGTVLYMAPEQLTGKPIGPYSDVYAVGLLLYEMLAGEPAYEGGNAYEVMANRLNDPIPYPDWLARSKFGPIVRKAVSEESSERYPSARELYEALDALDPKQLLVGPASGSELFGPALGVENDSAAGGLEFLGNDAPSAPRWDPALETLPVKKRTDAKPAAPLLPGPEITGKPVQPRPESSKSEAPKESPERKPLEVQTPSTPTPAPQPKLDPKRLLVVPESTGGRIPSLPHWLSGKLLAMVAGAIFLCGFWLLWTHYAKKAKDIGDAQRAKFEESSPYADFEAHAERPNRRRGSTLAGGLAGGDEKVVIEPSDEPPPLFDECGNEDAEACVAVARQYEKGEGLPKDDNKAAEYFQRACDFGSVEGCGNLAAMMTQGRGVEYDPARASVLLKTSCNSGHMASCYNLGEMYRVGVGVKVDFFSAKSYFKKACGGSFMEGCDALDRLEP